MRLIRHTLTAFGLFAAVTSVRAQDPPPDPNVEVLTRGPVHEAYANAVTSQPVPGLFAPKQPPAPIEELPPAEKPAGDNVQWIPGYWAWDEDKTDYLWVSGFWRVPPPGRTWMPGVWRDSGNGQWQWTAGFWNVAAQPEVQYLPPPPAPVEAAPPPQPGPDYVYAPGTWVYRDTHYAWRPGFWYVYRPGWVYIPAHYAWTPYGHIFVDGYWDYPLRQRGVLFTPVYISASVYARPGYVYTPSYVVYDDALYGALFVRPGGGYYFGDYFEARYTSMGYRSWFSVSVGFGPRDPYPYRYDPLFVYYRRTNGPAWAVQVNNVYVERARFPESRPPRTLVQQNIVVNNITNNTTIVNNNNSVKNVTMVSSVKNVDKSVVNMTTITPQQRQQAAQGAQETRQAAVQRVKAEAQLAPTGRSGPSLAPRTVKLDLPKSPVVAAAPTTPDKAPPPLPHTPVHPATTTTKPPDRPVTAVPSPGTPVHPATPPGPPPSGSKPPERPTISPAPPGHSPIPPPPPGPSIGQAPKTPMPTGPMPPGTRPLPPGQQPPPHQSPPGQKPSNERDRDRPPDRP
jgi:hypothetical protein